MTASTVRSIAQALPSGWIRLRSRDSRCEDLHDIVGTLTSLDETAIAQSTTGGTVANVFFPHTPARSTP